MIYSLDCGLGLERLWLWVARIRELVRISHRTFGFCFSDVTSFRDVAVTEQSINTRGSARR